MMTLDYLHAFEPLGRNLVIFPSIILLLIICIAFKKNRWVFPVWALTTAGSCLFSLVAVLFFLGTLQRDPGGPGQIVAFIVFLFYSPFLAIFIILCTLLRPSPDALRKTILYPTIGIFAVSIISAYMIIDVHLTKEIVVVVKNYRNEPVAGAVIDYKFESTSSKNMPFVKRASGTKKTDNKGEAVIKVYEIKELVLDINAPDGSNARIQAYDDNTTICGWGGPIGFGMVEERPFLNLFTVYVMPKNIFVLNPKIVDMENKIINNPSEIINRKFIGYDKWLIRHFSLLENLVLSSDVTKPSDRLNDAVFTASRSLTDLGQFLHDLDYCIKTYRRNPDKCLQGNEAKIDALFYFFGVNRMPDKDIGDQIKSLVKREEYIEKNSDLLRDILRERDQEARKQKIDQYRKDHLLSE